MSEKLLPISKLPQREKGEWERTFDEIKPGTFKLYVGDRARAARLMYYYLKKRGKLPAGLKLKVKNIADKANSETAVYMEAEV